VRPEGFAEYRNELVHDWSRIVAALGFCLIPLFLVLDYFTMPGALLSRFAWYRAAATLLALIHYVVVRRTRPSRLSFLHGYLFTAYVGGMIVQMTVDLGGFNSSYYAGLILVLVAVNLLLPWRAIHSAINGAMLLTGYVVANATLGGPFDVPVLINNLYFLSSTVIIAVAINHTKHRLIQQEFDLRAELLDANANLDRSREDLKSARDALWGEMEMAKRIQTALLPGDRKLGRYEICAVMRPADEVGGDYYDIISTRHGEHWVAIGDVSGHGVESGLVMMMTQTSVWSTVNDLAGRAPSEVFDAVNHVIRENISRLQTTRYMTLNLVRLHEDRLTVAGKHQDLLIWRKAQRKVEVVSNEGCWIGVVPDTRGLAGDLDVPLGEGDLLLLFTDGVTEATSASGEMFGEERLAEALHKVAELPLPTALQTLLSQVQRFQSQREDDVTLMLIRAA
ncbi:MAG: PP2C family protein-serine/threonine phosphatase, partial [Myxococcales bacterium]